MQADVPFKAQVPDGIEQAGPFGAVPDDLEMQWQAQIDQPADGQQSVFIAFAPKDDPKIAVSVYVQNAGQGARAAASVAGLMIEKYLKGSIDRKWIEAYAKRGEFIY